MRTWTITRPASPRILRQGSCGGLALAFAAAKPEEGESERRGRALFDILRSLDASLRRRLVAIYLGLGLLTIGAWAWAILAFATKPALLSVALLIYGLGLRHAVDADHIAAIDNATRKLMQSGARPLATGLFFALGHSLVVLIAAAAVAGAATFVGDLERARGIGSGLGTAVSALFLLAVAAMNVVIFVSIFRSYRAARSGQAAGADVEALLNGRGLLARLFRPLFRLITKSWHMFPLGFLFGLGFDTATEVAVLGVAAAQATKGVPLGALMAFPVLFAAGMAVVDTTDGVLMLGAYEWAAASPARRLICNMTVTLVSVAVALVIGGVEIMGLAADTFGLAGGVWAWAETLDANSAAAGLVIVGIFAAAWGTSWTIDRFKRGGAISAAEADG
jgi:high-affinity nickel-transport protein